MLDFFRRRRRDEVRDRPFPPEWREIVARNVAMFHRLDAHDRAELQRKILVFLEEKSFEGCGGLELTDEIRVTIAAQACIPILRFEDHYYPRLRSILVYPTTFVARRERREGGWVREEDEALLGESWHDGALVLSWASVDRDVHDAGDARNVVIHEFAHQLDTEDGGADGTPPLPRAEYAPWVRILGGEYLALREAVGDDAPHLLDGYGAKSEAEFFAVASETFFEKPAELLREHPGLYAELCRYYRQDPASWAPAPADPD
ncbi:M90 family metallopeptidase [Longimicrobium sp.]|uniref:M90 family metallopeptidase n=1 Tax=Longimicrobium sp. TaxID=2029185 RepID=UPI002D0ED55E|nr:M90 family metallopeptidase [Longimicrobium sp.]HSU15177.1 M90 family metallopeptidase [Longimicrobium sp.]